MTHDTHTHLYAPSIISVTRNLVTPTSAQPVIVTAQISDNSAFVASANLFYAVGVGNTSYTSTPMTLATGTNTNGTWTASIPAQANGAFVKYYVGATDDSSNTGYNHAVPSGQDPYFFTVRARRNPRRWLMPACPGLAHSSMLPACGCPRCMSPR